jgi:hypothetical protein
MLDDGMMRRRKKTWVTESLIYSQHNKKEHITITVLILATGHIIVNGIFSTLHSLPIPYSPLLSANISLFVFFFFNLG